MYSTIFNKIHLDKNEIIELLAFKIGENLNEANNVFKKIKSNIKENKKSPDIILDFIDEYDNIYNEYCISYTDAKILAFSMGWNIDTNERININ